MQKQKDIVYKIFKFLFFNFTFLIILLFCIEITLFCKYSKENNTPVRPPKYMYHFKKPMIWGIKLENFFDGTSNIGLKGRKPDGLEYKEEPVVVFGCSYAYGQYLKQNQTFSHKLVQLLKRPIYNRAIIGTSVQQMYYQVCDEGNKYFFKEVPPSDTVIYVMINNHYARTVSYVFFDMFHNIFQPVYKIKNDKPVYQDNAKMPNVIIKQLYLSKFLDTNLSKRYLKNEKNAEEISDLFLRFFIEVKQTLEKKWDKKINFVVLMYTNNSYQDYKNILLRKKLEDNGFIVITTMPDLTIEDLKAQKYIFKDNGHPTEAAWDLITPLFVKKLKDMNIL